MSDTIKETPAPINTVCPHCGTDTTIPKIKIEEEDKDKWVRYILSQGKRRFTKTYSVYNGMVNFTLCNRTPIEERDVDSGLPFVLRDIPTIADFAKIRMETFKLQLVFSLVSVSIRKEESRDFDTISMPIFSNEEIQAAWKRKESVSSENYSRVLESVQSPVLSLIVDKLVDFNTLCAALTVQGLSKDF